MKKYFIIPVILFLAVSCGKHEAAVQQTQSQNQAVQNAPAQIQQATSTPAGPEQKPPVAEKPAPLTLLVYNNAAEHFKFLYLNYFDLFTGASVKANNTKGVNFSACTPYGLSPDMCFVLKNDTFQNTNLESAAVSVLVYKGKTGAECAAFDAQEVAGGQVLGAVQVNDVVFMTAKNTDAGAGNFSETHFSRALYGDLCYEIDETARWTNAQNFNPPKAEFDKTDIWSKLDVLRNGFRFIK